MNKKILILTGAGALSPWKDKGWPIPSSEELTKTLREDKVFLTSCQEPLGELFYKFLANIMQEKYVNFERILDLLDNLSSFLSGEAVAVMTKNNGSFQKWIKDGYIDQNGKICPEACLPKDTEEDMKIFGHTWYPSSYLPGLYDLRSKIRKKLFNFETYEPLKKQHGQKNEAEAKESYVKEVLYHFVDLIIKKIEPYALKQDSNGCSQLNKQWNNFLEFLGKKFEQIRIYTLNYDRLPVNISKFDFFDGFNQNGQLEIKRLLEDNDRFSYINLHGSVHWNYDEKAETLQCDRGKVFRYCQGAVAKSEFSMADPNGASILDGLIKKDILIENASGDVYLKRSKGQIISRPAEISGSNFDKIFNILNQPAIKRVRQKIENREDFLLFNIITGLQKPFRVLEQPWYRSFSASLTSSRLHNYFGFSMRSMLTRLPCSITQQTG